MSRPSYDEFSAWAKDNLDFDPADRKLRSWVEANLTSFRNSVEGHPCILKIQQLISENQATSSHRSINLISSKLEMNVKSFESIMSKCYRVNILNNKNFPKEPDTDWLVPENLFTSINDLIRTTIVCRHIDEPERISKHIAQYSAAEGLSCQIDVQAKERGYYAFHVYIKVPVVITDQAWNQADGFIDVEIQLTTEMQYILYGLTHVFYEKERHEQRGSDESWKWNYKSSRFAASYISHSLHLLEGMILRLYEDVKPVTKDEPIS